MTFRRRQLLLCVGAVLAPVAGIYSAFGFVWCLWLDSVGRGGGYAFLLAVAAAAGVLASAGAFLYCVVVLLRGWRMRVSTTRVPPDAC